jgi:hypothetical protein
VAVSKKVKTLSSGLLPIAAAVVAAVVIAVGIVAYQVSQRKSMLEPGAGGGAPAGQPSLKDLLAKGATAPAQVATAPAQVATAAPAPVAPPRRIFDEAGKAADPADLTEPWQKDWIEFCKKVATYTTRQDATPQEVNGAMVGRTVEWTGTVIELLRGRPAPAQDCVRLAMDPFEIPIFDGHKVKTTGLAVCPEAAEWPAWANLKPGTRVVFRTRLVGNNRGPVFMIVQKMTMFVVRTEGAQLVRVLPEAAPEAPASPPAR